MMDAPTRRRWAEVLLEILDDRPHTMIPKSDGTVRIVPNPPAALADDLLEVRDELREMIRERDEIAGHLVEGAESRGVHLHWCEERQDLVLGFSRVPSEEELTPAGLNGLLTLLRENERACENFCRRTGRTEPPEPLEG